MARNTSKFVTRTQLKAVLHNSSDPLKTLLDRGHQLVLLDDCLKKALPPTLQGQVRVASLENGTLVLNAATSAWAAKLRYMTPELSRHLCDNYGERWLRAI